MDSPLSTERLKAAYLAAAELVAMFGSDAQPFMDHWEARLLARYRSQTALKRAYKLIAKLDAELATLSDPAA